MMVRARLRIRLEEHGPGPQGVRSGLSVPVLVEVFVLKTSGARQVEHTVTRLGFKIAMQRRLACAIYYPT
jgi:hypothetical protein